MLDSAFAVDADSGAVLARYGAPWTLDAAAAGAELDGSIASHRAFYGAARARYGRAALADPTSAVATGDGRILVASGYYDARVVVFDNATGALLGDVARGLLLSPAAMVAAMTDASPAAPLQAGVSAHEARQAVAWLRLFGGARGVSARFLDALDRAAAPPASFVTLQAMVGALDATNDTGLVDDPRIMTGDVRGDGVADAGLPPTHVAAQGDAWPWRNPHALDLDTRRRLLWVADRERPAIDALNVTTLDLVCTYPLAALDTMGPGAGAGPGLGAAPGRAFAVVATPPAGGVDTRGRLFALLAHDPVSGSHVVELDPEECGAIKARYPVPLGAFPQHDLTVATRPDGSAVLCVAAQPTQVYELPPRAAAVAAGLRAASSDAADAATIASLLTVQWVTLLVLAAAVPGCVLAVRLGRGVATGVTRLAGARRDACVQDDEEAPATPLQTSSVAAAAAAGVAAMAAAANVASAVSAAGAGAPTGGQPRAVAASPFALATEAGAPLATQPLASPKAEPSAASPAAPVEPSASPSKPGTLFFIRHGESTSNERGVLAGVRDVDLTRFGRLQARAAAPTSSVRRPVSRSTSSTCPRCAVPRAPRRANPPTCS